MVYPLIIIGSDGFIGRHFARAFPDAFSVNRTMLDLLNPKITFPVEGYRYALIAAGISNPAGCELEPEKSYACNVTGTLALGKELRKRGVIPIFCSSDYVFDERLAIMPLNAYGRQKAELEKKGVEMDALVLRLSKVYGIEKNDRTLFDEMASTLDQRKLIRAAKDQIFPPIFIGDVIQQVRSLIEKQMRGVQQISGPSFASRYEMALLLAKKMGVETNLVKPIEIDEIEDGVKRPRQLRISSSWPGMQWEEGIERVAKNYGA